MTGSRFPPVARLGLTSPLSRVLSAAPTSANPSPRASACLARQYLGPRLVLDAKCGAVADPIPPGRLISGSALSCPALPQEVRRPPKFPSLPCEPMPRSQTPATRRRHRPSSSPILPSGRCTPSASTTLQISGLHHAAWTLAPPGFTPHLAVTHARFATDLRTGFGRMGLSPTGRQ